MTPRRHRLRRHRCAGKRELRFASESAHRSRRNPESVVIPFDTAAYEVKVDPNDSVLSLAQRLAAYGGGGTDCSLPLAMANGRYVHRRFVGCVLVSDNDSRVGTGRHDSTAVMREWQTFAGNQVG